MSIKKYKPEQIEVQIENEVVRRVLGSLFIDPLPRLFRHPAAPDFPFDPDLLSHVSPIEWKNVILYGEIKIDPDKLRIRGR